MRPEYHSNTGGTQPKEIALVPLTMKKILLATDGSGPAVKATKTAIALARRIGAEILALYVENDTENNAKPSRKAQALFPDLHPFEAGLALAKALGRENGVVVRTTVFRGSVSRSILKAAQAEDTDLIVIGDSGRKGNQAYLGQVAETVLRLAPMPVLLVR